MDCKDKHAMSDHVQHAACIVHVPLCDDPREPRMTRFGHFSRSEYTGQCQPCKPCQQCVPYFKQCAESPPVPRHTRTQRPTARATILTASQPSPLKASRQSAPHRTALLCSARARAPLRTARAPHRTAPHRKLSSALTPNVDVDALRCASKGCGVVTLDCRLQTSPSRRRGFRGARARCTATVAPCALRFAGMRRCAVFTGFRSRFNLALRHGCLRCA